MEIDYSYFYGMLHFFFLLSKYIKNLYLRHALK